MFFAVFANVSRAVCIQSRSEQCRRGRYLFVTSSHHACPLETDGYDPKINAFIVLCKRLLQVGDANGCRLATIGPFHYVIKEPGRFGSVSSEYLLLLRSPTGNEDFCSAFSQLT